MTETASWPALAVFCVVSVFATAATGTETGRARYWRDSPYKHATSGELATLARPAAERIGRAWETLDHTFWDTMHAIEYRFAEPPGGERLPGRTAWTVDAARRARRRSLRELADAFHALAEVPADRVQQLPSTRRASLDLLGACHDFCYAFLQHVQSHEYAVRETRWSFARSPWVKDPLDQRSASLHDVASEQAVSSLEDAMMLLQAVPTVLEARASVRRAHSAGYSLLHQRGYDTEALIYHDVRKAAQRVLRYVDFSQDSLIGSGKTKNRWRTAVITQHKLVLNAISSSAESVQQLMGVGPNADVIDSSSPRAALSVAEPYDHPLLSRDERKRRLNELDQLYNP